MKKEIKIYLLLWIFKNKNEKISKNFDKNIELIPKAKKETNFNVKNIIKKKESNNQNKENKFYPHFNFLLNILLY